MILPLFLFLALAAADSLCELRLILNDDGGDGWEDNYLTGTSNGAPIDFQPIDCSVSVKNGNVTLLRKDIGSLRFKIPSGSGFQLNYFAKNAYTYENSWVVELWNIYNPFGSVVLSKSYFVTGKDGPLPYADPVQYVYCGPTPPPASNIQVSPNQNTYVTAVTWDKHPAHDDSVVFTLSYTRSDDPTTIVYWGVSKTNTFSGILPSGAQITMTVEALNKFGPSTPLTSAPFTPPSFVIGRLFLRLYDSDGSGWGVDDGGVAVYINDLPHSINSMECHDGGGCYSQDHAIDLPAGIKWNVVGKFLPPTKGREDCSFKFYRTDGAILFDSGLDANGPITEEADFSVYFDDGCPCADPWGECVPTSGVCGAGRQLRHSYHSIGPTQCQAVEEYQDCSVPCPVACVGNFSAWGACSPACGVAYASRVYTIYTQADNKGDPCPYPDGYKETSQCTDQPECLQLCAYVWDLFDYEQDGWGGSYATMNIQGRDPIQASLLSSTDDSFQSSMARISFQAPRGTSVVINWTPVTTDGHEAQEAAFSITPVVAGQVLKNRDVLQQPPNLDLKQSPAATSSFTAFCVDCSKADFYYCNSLNRVQCEFAQAADNTCGACQDGYQSTAHPEPYNEKCDDIDECEGINPCLLKNAKCQNVPGSFVCYCGDDPTVPTDTQCPGQTYATSFVEVGSKTKIFEKMKYVDNLPPNTKSCPSIITRKEWSEMTSDEKTTWVNAVKAMYDVFITQNTASGNVQMNFWQYTRQLHYLVSAYPGPYVHGNLWFLPWHRQFLDDVEGYIRTRTESCLFIPFYDSSRLVSAGTTGTSPTSPMDIYANNRLCNANRGIINTDSLCNLRPFPNCDPSFDNYDQCKEINTASDYQHSQLWRQSMMSDTSTLSGPTDYYSILTDAKMTDFSNDLESAHGGYHVWVGGWMGQLETAAGDPLFLSHHAFIDSLWATWQSCNGLAAANKANAKVWDNDFSGLAWLGAMPKAHSTPPSATYNILNLGYRYSYEFLNTLHSVSTRARTGLNYCYADTGATVDWFAGMKNSDGTLVTTTAAPSPVTTTTAAPTSPPTTTTAKPTNPPTTTTTQAPPPPPTTTTTQAPPPPTKTTTTTQAPPPPPPPTTPAPTTPVWTIPGWVQVVPPQVPSSQWIYEGIASDGTHWLFVPYTQGNWNQGYYINPGRWQDFTAKSFLEKNSSSIFFLEHSEKKMTHARRIMAAPDAPYTPYKGYYKRNSVDTDVQDKYSAHGGRGKHRAKGACHESKELKNWRKLRRAFKDEYAKTKDDKLALEAMARLQCTLNPHKVEVPWTDKMIEGMHRQKACARGLCHDPCYRQTKGKNAKRRTKRYVKKHGKFPAEYKQSLNETEGYVPNSVSLIEEEIYISSSYPSFLEERNFHPMPPIQDEYLYPIENLKQLSKSKVRPQQQHHQPNLGPMEY